MFLSRVTKIALVIFFDIIMCFFALWLSYSLRLEKLYIFNFYEIIIGIILSTIIILVLLTTNSYKIIFRFSGVENLIKIFFCFLLYGSLTFFIFTIITIENVPRSIGILFPLILFLMISLSRIVLRYLINFYNSQNKKYETRMLIYGAGNAGFQVVSSLQNNNTIKAIGLIDDNPLLRNRRISNLKIYHSDDLENIISKFNINHILIAIPSLKIHLKKKIIDKISKYKISISTLPNLNELYKGKISTSDFKNFDINDLLERDPVEANEYLLKKNIKLNTILVTGAGGSIGSELCRQIIKLSPRKLVLIENNEFSLYKIKSELSELLIKYKIEENFEIKSFLVSIENIEDISDIIKNEKPDTVYHAAAYKHVPLVEENICSSLRNNIFGTLNLIKSSINYRVSNFVLISSDKAVRPTNVMGVSKRIAEICLQSICRSQIPMITKFSAVRFGNVLVSSGSVIPKFLKQIKSGGPITLTHNDVTRYFMTVNEAAQLVIQASAMCTQGDIFVLDMGKPIEIRKLIIRLTKLCGYSIKDKKNPDGDVEIKLIGLRQGEKIHEELMLGTNPKKTSHPKIQKTQDSYVKWDELEKNLKVLEKLIMSKDIKKILIKLSDIVPDYYKEGKF